MSGTQPVAAVIGARTSRGLRSTDVRNMWYYACSCPLDGTGCVGIAPKQAVDEGAWPDRSRYEEQAECAETS